MMRNTQHLRYFLYARKSNESEDRQMASIEDQKKEVQKIADELGLNVIGVFEESKSAKAPGRKVFNEVLLRIEKGEADAILCWKLNRLARNPVDGGKISWMLQNNIIKHIQCFGRDYQPNDNVLMMQVELGMANQFVKDLSVDVKRGMRQKAERGWFPSPVLPLGYIHNKDNKRRVLPKEIIKDHRYPKVKKLWKLMLTGAYSIADIKRKGDASGLVNDDGKPYVIHTYHKLFSSEFYCGYFYWRDDKGVLKKHKGKHPKMVTQEEFDKVQVFIGNYKKPTRAKSYQFTYRGLMTCGECGCNITAERKFQVRCTYCRYKFSCRHRNTCSKCETPISEMTAPTIIDITYYRCTKRKGNCSQKTITETVLEQEYIKAIKNISIPKDFYDFMCQALQELEQEEYKEDLQEIGQLKKRISELQSRLSKLTMMRADDEISKEQFTELQQQTLEQISLLEQELKASNGKLINWKTVAQDYLNFALSASTLLENASMEHKKQLLLQLGSNQQLLDKKLYFIKAKPLLAIQKCWDVYKSKNGRFEPKNHLAKQGDSSDLDTPNTLLCTELHKVRTSCIQVDS